MADLPITSDEGAQPVVINDPTTAANVANVKAASTAAVVADNSLVVALSPNSPTPTGTNTIGTVVAKNQDGLGNNIASIPPLTGVATAGNFLGGTVNQYIFASTNNSSTTNLASAASFTGVAD